MDSTENATFIFDVVREHHGSLTGRPHAVDPNGLLRSPLLLDVPGVVHGFSTRRPDLDALLDALPAPGARVTAVRQVHGNRVHVVSEVPRTNPVADADALVTRQPGTSAIPNYDNRFARHARNRLIF